MRKISFSSKCWWTRSLSCRALARSWPNGFSTMRRVHPLVVRALPSAVTIGPKAFGGTAR